MIYTIDKVIGEGGFSKVLLVRVKDGHKKDGDSNVCASVFRTEFVCHSYIKLGMRTAQVRCENYPKVASQVRRFREIVRQDYHGRMAGESFFQATMLERNILGDVGYDRIDADICERLSTETRRFRRHPFILKLFHSFQEKDRLVLIVDFCVGGSVHYHVNLAVRTSLDQLMLSRDVRRMQVRRTGKGDS